MTDTISILIGGSAVGLLAALGVAFAQRHWGRPEPEFIGSSLPTANVARETWPPLDHLPSARLSLASRIWMIVLRGHLIVAGGLVLVRIFRLATAGA